MVSGAKNRTSHMHKKSPVNVDFKMEKRQSVCVGIVNLLSLVSSSHVVQSVFVWYNTVDGYTRVLPVLDSDCSGCYRNRNFETRQAYTLITTFHMPFEKGYCTATTGNCKENSDRICSLLRQNF
ncbi:hypothetical protein CBL_07073 [Carabus blaptoides fortunei]